MLSLLMRCIHLHISVIFFVGFITSCLYIVRSFAFYALKRLLRFSTLQLDCISDFYMLFVNLFAAILSSQFICAIYI